MDDSDRQRFGETLEEVVEKSGWVLFARFALKGWIRNPGGEKFVHAVVHPSAEIAHGYSGSRVELKDGREIHGLTVSIKDPLIVQSQEVREAPCRSFPPA